MPFIDDDLLWCPDNDGKMVDLSQCLQEGASGQQQDPGGGPQGLGELSQSDLTGLVSSLDEEEDDLLFKQLDDSSFELDNFFTDLEEKEENNNNVVQGGGRGAASAGDLVSSSTPSPSKASEARAASRKLNIVAANPLLAEKLAAPPPLIPIRPPSAVPPPIPSNAATPVPSDGEDGVHRRGHVYR
ncbi:ecdysone-induced protein 74EF-like isoform X2 [Bacillus rossius redtenbacheri]|uniref:ecdysone-induced protein 74EF-like isoform X2 n=1 Tax=Bacillus rossius redtenbacheri TaxID=93214 RepID=UPI002FDC9633